MYWLMCYYEFKKQVNDNRPNQGFDFN